MWKHTPKNQCFKKKIKRKIRKFFYMKENKTQQTKACGIL